MVRVTCGRTHFWTFFDPLLIPEWGISKGFGGKWSLKMATNSPETGLGCTFEHHKRSRLIFEKTRFQPSFQWPFRSQNGPFEGLSGPNSASKRSEMGSKQPENVSWSTSNGPGSSLEKLNFGHFQTILGAVLWLFWGQSTPCTTAEKTGKT